MNPTDLLRSGPCAFLLPFALSCATLAAQAQDRFLVYGNSIVANGTVAFFKDIVAQTGVPSPLVITAIASDMTTTNYVNQINLITSSLPAGQTWRAMYVEGGTIENVPGLGNPTAFQNNMQTLANAFFTHSPSGVFIGHETGADHPNSANYPTIAPDPATWLAWSHNAYAAAAQAITAAHPSNPPARIAPQGTCFAATAGYPTLIYRPDYHHPSAQGSVLIAVLWYIAAYGGRAQDIPVDFTALPPSALVTRLLANSIDQANWLRLVGWADGVQPPTARLFPGSSGDFQLLSAITPSIPNLVTDRTLTGSGSVRLQLFSPLGASQNQPAVVYGELLPTGTTPPAAVSPSWIDPLHRRLLLQVPNLAGGPVDILIPPGLAGQTLWLQAVSRSLTSGLVTYSDAQRVILQ